MTTKKILLIIAIMMLPVGCVSDKPEMTAINGKTVVQTHLRFFGLRVWTKSEDVRTPAQERDALDIDREREEQQIALNRKKRQEWTAFVLGALCMGGVLVCAVIGYFTKGWKVWGGLAALLGVFGSLYWGFAHWIPYLKWPTLAVFVGGLIYSLYQAKDFSAKEAISQRIGSKKND